MLKRSLLILALLVCCACSKSETPKPDAAPPEALAALAASAAPAGTESAPEEDPGDGSSIDEPMPPVDESGSVRVIARGTLQPVDAAQPVAGSLTIYEADDGSRLLRLEDVQTGGALDVALVRSSAPKTAADLQDKLALGALKGARGNMNYLITSGTALGDRRTLVLIDSASGEPRGYAALQKP